MNQKTLFVIFGLFGLSATAFAVDADGDGVDSDKTVSDPPDCDDNDAANKPGAVEDCTDGKDNNCDGLIDSADTVGCPAGVTVQTTVQTAAASLSLTDVTAACTKCEKSQERIDHFGKFATECYRLGGTIAPEKCRVCDLPDTVGGMLDWTTVRYWSASELQDAAQGRDIKALQEHDVAQDAELEAVKAELADNIEAIRIVSEKADATAAELRVAKADLESVKVRVSDVERRLDGQDDVLESFRVTIDAIESKLVKRIDALEKRIEVQERSVFAFEAGAFGTVVGQHYVEIEKGDLVRRLRPNAAGGAVLSLGVTQRKYGARSGLFYGGAVIVDLLGEQMQNDELVPGTAFGFGLGGQGKLGYAHPDGFEIGGLVEAGYHGTGMVGPSGAVTSARIGGGLQIGWDLAMYSSLHLAPAVQFLVFAEPTTYDETDDLGHNKDMNLAGSGIEIRIGIFGSRDPVVR